MKTTAVYSSLTMPQRLRAMVSAAGRRDDEELERLRDTSQDGYYSFRKVSRHYLSLAHLAVIHNCFLLDSCAVWLFTQMLTEEEVRNLSEELQQGIPAFRIKCLEEAASMEAAITGRVTGLGISASDWQTFRERLIGHGAKELLQLFLPKTTGREKPALVAQWEDAIESYLFKDAA